jgi:hypothetical protein
VTPPREAPRVHGWQPAKPRYLAAKLDAAARFR